MRVRELLAGSLLAVGSVAGCATDEELPEGIEVSVNDDELARLSYADAIADLGLEEPVNAAEDEIAQSTVDNTLDEAFAVYEAPNTRTGSFTDLRGYGETIIAFCYTTGSQEAWVGVHDDEDQSGYIAAYARFGGVAEDTVLYTDAQGSTYATLSDLLPDCDKFVE